MMESALKIGIIGAGRMGSLHFAKFRSISDIQVCGVFDTNEMAASRLCAETGARAYSNLSELLFDADAVVVATPTESHFAVVKRALESGTHVLVEKPMTERLEEGTELARLARSHDLVLQVGFVERFRIAALFDGPLSLPVRFLESDRLAAQLGRDLSTDVVTDLMIHDLDLVLSLVNEEPSLISAIGIPVVTGRWDLASVRLEFPSGAVANLSASRVSAVAQRRFRMFGENSYTSIDFIANTASRSVRLVNGEIERKVVEAGNVDALALQAKSFVQAVTRRERPLVTGEDAVRALRVAKQIQAAIADRVSRAGWAPRELEN